MTTEDVMKRWNEFAKANGLPTILKLTMLRERQLTKRLADGVFDLEKILAKIKASDFLMGKSERSNGHECWQCTFDFVFCDRSNHNWVKILEGNYDNKKPAGKASGYEIP